VAAAEENPLAVVEESTSLLHAETVTQGAEATLLEASGVEGMYTSTTLFSSGNHSPRVLTSHVL
jgi:hypothetical protein